MMLAIPLARKSVQAAEGLSDVDTKISGGLSRTPPSSRCTSLDSSPVSQDRTSTWTDSDSEELQAELSSSCRVVVKSTFLDMAEGPGVRARFFQLRGKSKTDSVLEVRKDVDDSYEPGAFADAAMSSSCPANVDMAAVSAFVPIATQEANPILLQPFLPVVAIVTYLPCPSPSQEQPQQQQEQQEQQWQRNEQEDQLQRQQQRGASPQRTTVMLRNVPNNYTRQMLLDMLDGQGFFGLYDFLYLPMDFGRKANLGYAFVNLVDSETTSAFWTAFDGFSQWALPTAKVCEVSWSGPFQGLQAHVQRYKNSPVMHHSVPDEYKPMIFAAGVRQPFPPPSKKLSRPGKH